MAYEIVPCMYDTEKDLQARLHGTICRYDNIPVYVTVRSAKEIVIYDPISVGLSNNPYTDNPVKLEEKIIRPTDPLFDISSPELGYLNYDYDVEVMPRRRGSASLYDSSKTETSSKQETGNLVLYLRRSPNRQWKQGLNCESTYTYMIDGAMNKSKIGIHSLFYSHALKNLIQNSYPTLPTAVMKLNRMTDQMYQQIAISKDIALERTPSDIIQVYVKRENVGYILPGQRTLHLKKGGNSWVSRRIIEELKLVAV